MIHALYFALLATFWGGSFVAIKLAVGILPPFLAGTLRVLVSLGILTTLFRIQGRSLKVPRDLRLRVWIAGLFAQGIPFSLIFWGERSISPGLAGILNGTVPIWTFLLGAWLIPGQEPFSRRKLAGSVSALAGVVLIFWRALLADGPASEVLGTIAVIAMAVCYGIGTLMNRRILAGGMVDFHANVYQQAVASVTYLAVCCLLFEHGTVPTAPDATALLHAGLAVLYLGTCSTALAFLMYFRLVREWGAVRAASVNYLLPAMSILISYLLTGDLPTGAQLTGASFILAGVLLIQLPLETQIRRALPAGPTGAQRARATGSPRRIRTSRLLAVWSRRSPSGRQAPGSPITMTVEAPNRK